MKNLVAFTLGLSLAACSSASYASQTVCSKGTTGIVLETTGLGKGGYACNDSGFIPTHPWARVTIITGDTVDPIVTIKLDTHGTEQLRPDGLYTHAICIAMPAWTMPWYSGGFPIPEWPWAFLDQSEDDNGRIVPGASNATIRIRILDALHGLEPHSNYSLNVGCG
jgi:hypothetical protein